MIFHPLNSNIEPPLAMNNPFDYEPHPLCLLAADEVRGYLKHDATCESDARNGKMFGVLVVKTSNGVTGFLAAYSGLLAGRNDWAWFVPPVFDAQQPDGHFKQTERQISAINRQIREWETNEEDAATHATALNELRQQRKQMSEELQRWLFEQYLMLNERGERRNLIDIWHDYHTSPRLRQRFPLPPGGSGDCCAPKLLQYAFLHQMKPLCIAEFWYGASPKAEIRHHGHFYPACRGKCLPILTYMLGTIFSPSPVTQHPSSNTQHPSPPLPILYDDEWLAVVSKPAGMLSVPGREEQRSVFTLMRQRFPEADGPLMVHRLDMATSGLIVIAKSKEVHKLLQRQFSERKVKKRYVAVIEGVPSARSGIITLPLCPNPLDRPRQMVDHEVGKEAVTRYEVTETKGTRARVNLYPQTGRTHQLRMHCAHEDGLACPIVGDELYGTKAERLHLHAAEITFTHPLTGKEIHIVEEPEF